MAGHEAETAVGQGGPEGPEPARRSFPDFVIIGAMKCGTSSLHEYLDLHPDICMSRPKEPRYFTKDRYEQRSPEWYASHFTAKPQARHRGESSPHYTMRSVFPDVAARMRGVLPDARLVYLVRDPLDRIASHWMHFTAAAEIRHSFEAELADLDASLAFQNSRYHWQLEAWLEHFPAERILVVQSERLSRDPRTVTREVLAFLGIDPGFDHPGFDRRFHETASKVKPNAIGRAFFQNHIRMKWRAVKYVPWLVGTRLERPVWEPALRERVAGALAADLAALRSLTGQQFEGWSV